MNTNFLNTIKEKNNSTKGIDELFYSMASVEEYHWNTIKKENITNWTQIFSKIANDNISKIAIIEVDNGTKYTYGQLESASDKICAFITQNITSYHIGLNYHNSFFFIAALIGINKAKRLAILFNNREPQERQVELAHSSDTNIVFGNPISGCVHYDIESILKKPKIDTKKNNKQINLEDLDDPAFVIFTSGTTGKSKGALFSHRRMLGAGIAWSLRTGMDASDNCYIPLPLYHGNGLAVALSSVFYAKACASIRIKYSTTHFFSDIEKYSCTHMCYIGELWRYILNRYTEGKRTTLKVIFGNGLNKELWDSVTSRYGIEHVVEHFGATEMPAGALTNWYDISGYCGYLPKDDPKAQDMILVDEAYQKVKDTQSGQALFLVPSGVYKGYIDSSLDASKLKKDLLKIGDVWWESGDLLAQNKDGFFTFIERLGDTYRYKGENIACVDVEDGIRKCGTFEEVVVYGITLPKVSGKIGMASLVSKTPIDLKDFECEVKKHLPNYSLPYFLILEKDKHTTTSTMKIQKTLLSKKSINEYKTKNIYVLTSNEYKRIDEIVYDIIMNGQMNL